MSTQVALGAVVTHNGSPWRVVRIIHESLTLFEPEDGDAYIIRESYLELKSGNGGIDFISLFREKIPYQGNPSQIRGLEPILWQEEQGDQTIGSESDSGGDPSR